MDSNLSSTDSALPPCIDKLKEEFTCAICLNVFFEPVTISCGHSFCRNCLLVATDKYKERCPICRQWIKISEENFPNVSIVMWNTIQVLFPQEVEASTSIASQEADNMIIERDDPFAQPDDDMDRLFNRLDEVVENRLPLSNILSEIRLRCVELNAAVSRLQDGSIPPPPPPPSPS
ncbi:hypothetical protein RYX36_002759 [Vicia faba]